MATADAEPIVPEPKPAADVRREADGRTYHALVRFRAVTEPLP